ncbi:MAG: hypothetical protein JRE23_08740 [Deltaproteobacteria bacterium]|nr:hypothetical protein [Deltaproteobacteria bacterium]
MAFCIHHQHCKSGGVNGNCVTFPPTKVDRVNRGLTICGRIDQSIVTGEKKKSTTKKRNPLKQSKMDG